MPKGPDPDYGNPAPSPVAGISLSCDKNSKFLRSLKGSKRFTFGCPAGSNKPCRARLTRLHLRAKNISYYLGSGIFGTTAPSPL